MKRFFVVEVVQKDGQYYPLIPPLECERGIGEDGWWIQSDKIKVEGCISPAQAHFAFETMLQELIAAGVIKMDMGDPQMN